MRMGEIIVTFRFDDLFVNHFECLENGSKLLSAVILFPHVSDIVLHLLLHWNLRIPLAFDLRDTKLKGVPSRGRIPHSSSKKAKKAYNLLWNLADQIGRANV